MTDFEQIDLEKRWKSVLKFISESFGEVEDIKDIIFLIGLQELGFGFRKLSKDEKVDVMHVGVSHLLSYFGYYEFVGRDAEGWPHWTLVNTLPEMNEKENELLLKRAIIVYFDK